MRDQRITYPWENFYITPHDYLIQSFFLSNLNAKYTESIALKNKATAIPIDGTNNAQITHKTDTNATININVLSLIIKEIKLYIYSKIFLKTGNQLALNR